MKENLYQAPHYQNLFKKRRLSRAFVLLVAMPLASLVFHAAIALILIVAFVISP